MSHDIIDNRNERLVTHINRILETTQRAHFAVGYFFVSGLTAIAERLGTLQELRLLIGNTTNRETIEQLAEGYRRLELVRDAAEAQEYPKRPDIKRMTAETANNIRASLELLDQTDEAERLLRTLVHMIEEGRIRVRVYTKGRLHAKAYVFDYGPVFDQQGRSSARHETGIAVVGSSNLTLAGVSHNTELNVIVHGNANHQQLSQWFEGLWAESQEFDESLMNEMRESWAVAAVRPNDIYLKTLYTLVRDRLEGTDDKDILWDDEITSRLADFQKVAVRQAVQIIRDFGGAFVADVVGLGKSYIGTAILKHFERTEHARPLIVCPAQLVDMWERYSEVYQLNARVVSMGILRQDPDEPINRLLDDMRYRDRDFVLVDESHNLRHPDTQRYRVLQGFLATGRRCCFLTATPRNKSAWDIYNQIKLFHQDDVTELPVDPPNLRDYFRLVERGERKLPGLLVNILIRRTRNHILRWYGYDGETQEPVDPSRFREYLEGRRQAYVIVGGRHQFFPRRELRTVEYSIEDTYQGLYQELRGYLGKSSRSQHSAPDKDELSYARYGLWHYVRQEKKDREPYASLHRAGANLRGLIRILLFKRFESSVHAFRETARRLLRVHELFHAALRQGLVPAGEDAQTLLYECDNMEEATILDALRQLPARYDARDFDLDKLAEHIEHDTHLLRKILDLVKPVTPDRDAKLQTLVRLLDDTPLRDGKRLIFTQYADTARYLFDNLNPEKQREDVDVIYSGDKSKTRVVGRFAPVANPEYRFPAGEVELMTLVATDVLAEGLNLQDCDKIVNYDLHWNPVRLVQRFGRIDRIGSEHERVYGFNFLPETGIERTLRLHEKLRHRIQEIHDTIGEDSAILDTSERLNEEAMYAIYEQKGGQLSLYEDEDEPFVDLNEAEELLRQLRRENPAEFSRIANLRDGIRSAMSSEHKGAFVFCQAGRYQQLFLVSSEGEPLSRDVPRVLARIRCGPTEKAQPLPAGYNSSIMKVMRLFTEEVKHRQSERAHTLSLTVAQRYVTRELRSLFSACHDDDATAQINLLEAAFRNPITTAINREINVLRRSGVCGEALLKHLARIYHQHSMREFAERRSMVDQDQALPRIICTEALV